MIDMYPLSNSQVPSPHLELVAGGWGALNASVALFFAVVTRVRQFEWIHSSLTCVFNETPTPSPADTCCL